MKSGPMAMSDRETILGRIRASLAVNRDLLEAEVAKAPPPHPTGPFVRSDLAPLDQFTAELEALHGHVHLCATEDEARDKLRSLLATHEARSVLHWDLDEIPLPGVGGMLAELGIESAEGHVVGAEDRGARIQALEPVPVCLSGADAAIAESGSILVVTGPGRGRLASLLPPIHIAILPADRLVRTLPQAFELLRRRFGADVVHQRANITIITGPSRSGDIEQTLTLGVHGPKEVHVIVLGDHTFES
jgi:L-lactate dehydrogenase complex protein LldG